MIDTERLILRHWLPKDLPELRRQSFDALGMRYLLPLPDEHAFQAMLARLDLWRDTLGHSFWAIERRSDGAFLGLCGFKRGAEGTPIADKLEIGWRLGVAHWGQGYAREAAVACLGWAAATLTDDSVYAITVPANTASWGLMERLGMHRLPDGDFDHPLVEDGSPLKRHITYRIDRPFVNHLR
ncbi:MAG: GNAT family N-acetyltransferase [Sphingomonas sp.]|nr:GNAT family N-acetyltransferase [Sphingomonas sp.]